jgi:hypothetical protein
MNNIGDIFPPPYPKPKPEPTPLFLKFLTFLGIFCIDFIVNAFFLTISYLILKEIKLTKSWRFLKYIFFATTGGILIDLIYVSGLYFTPLTIFGSLIIYPRDIEAMGILLGFFFLLFLSLTIFNYWLSQQFFHLPRRKAIFIGLIMGVFTNPVLPPLLYSLIGL